MNEFGKSKELFQRGVKLIPDGVSSPMRAFRLVDGEPVCIASAKGARIIDVDGNEYADYLCSFGATLVGHADERITQAIHDQLKKGTVYGLTSELEYQVAERIVRSSADIDQVRFVCSGSEAVMTAVRIARAHTGRKIIVKFVGSYHGHADALLAMPLSVENLTKGNTAGLDEEINQSVLMSAYNDIDELTKIFSNYGDDIAGVVVEPIATNMGLVLSNIDFLKAIRNLCSEFGSVFIADEVVTGFRLCYGPYTSSLGLEPDLITFGKIIGGGMPIGAYAGKQELMNHVKIGHDVFQSGTFASNPISMAAANAVLTVLAEESFYEDLNKNAEDFMNLIQKQFREHSIPFLVTRRGPLLGVAYRDSNQPMGCYDDVKTQNYNLFRELHQAMMKKSILMAPSMEEPIFISAAHQLADFEYFSSALAGSICRIMDVQMDKEIARLL